MAIDPSNGNFLLAGFRDCVYSSDDGGQSWHKSAGFTSNPLGLHIDQSSSIDQRRCFAAAKEGIFVSNDGGHSWEPVGEGLPDKELVDFAGGSTADQCVLYCTTESRVSEGEYIGGVYRSTDGGQTWTQAMGSGIEISERTVTRGGKQQTVVPGYRFLATSNLRPATVYVVQRRPNQVFRSDNIGESWRPTFFADPKQEDFNVEPSYNLAEAGEYWTLPRLNLKSTPQDAIS